MTVIDHKNELKSVKEKAYKILEERGVLTSLLIVLEKVRRVENLLEKFNSPVVEVQPNKFIEEQDSEKLWLHKAYLVDGETIQISFYEQQPYSPHYDEDFTEEQAYLYLIHNSEQVLFSKGSATRKHRDWGWEDWEFSQFGANRLELVKLDATWISAVNEISSELRRVEKLEKERYERHLQKEAEKEKSNFDLGSFG